MAQITRGLVDVTNGSAVVAGDSNALFSGGTPAVLVGDAFKVDGDITIYEILSVDSDTQITLTINYGGTTDTGEGYTIYQDFTALLELIQVNKGDADLAEILKRNFDIIDTLANNTTSVYAEGDAVDEATIFDGLFFPVKVHINKILIYAGTAPVGANLTIDILKGGTEQSKLATLTDGSAYETTTISGVTFTTTQRFGLKIKSVGSGTAGAKLNIIILWSQVA
jgi:hypothetical protein